MEDPISVIARQDTRSGVKLMLEKMRLAADVELRRETARILDSTGAVESIRANPGKVVRIAALEEVQEPGFFGMRTVRRTRRSIRIGPE